jgi:hypothetical protein
VGTYHLQLSQLIHLAEEHDSPPSKEVRLAEIPQKQAHLKQNAPLNELVVSNMARIAK